MADILLSYERTDRKRVAPIVALLEARGWSVEWEPAAETDDEPGAVRCIIAAWSIDSVDSGAMLAVASYGLARGMLISLSIDFSRPPPGLEEAPSVALAGWTGDESSPRAQELLTAVGGLLARAPARSAQPATKPAAQPAAEAGDNARPAVAQPAAPPEPAPAPALEPEPEPELNPEPDPDPESEIRPALELDPEAEPQPEPAADLSSAVRVPHLVQQEGTTPPLWTFPEEAEEDRSRPHLPPVLLRDRGPRPLSADDVPASAPARRGAAFALVAGLAIVAAAAAGGVFWLTGSPGGTVTTPDGQVAAVEVAPDTSPRPPPEAEATPTAPDGRPQEATLQAPKLPKAKPPEAKPKDTKPKDTKPKEVQPTPTALPQDKGLEIEDILGQVTPRVEELLADATRLISIGDIRGARKVLAAPETAQSGSLTFLLAETYDPNILPATLKGAMADPARARALYRKAQDLGDGRAQGRLDALKTSGWQPAAPRPVAYAACPAGLPAG
jgi:outer membrane biosynthesis protein TonB